ncbi:delta DNA polymerase [Ephemerocybe angulata]|uniref:DNA polymerase delta catalytic subunit n=1 Tax=Ephemerocybe angulata TaxID=980116 RepID=A0A8H6HZE5_9AGAR|nr:delta DNA polymerase [Tulosesus angulatus]
MAKRLKLDDSFPAALENLAPDQVLTDASNSKGKYTSDYGRQFVSLDNNSDSLVFQAIHLEEGLNVDRHGIIRVYGVTESGYPVSLTLEGFDHYFFFPAPPGFETEDLKPLQVHLNAIIPGALSVKDIALHRRCTYRDLFGNPDATYGCDLPYVSRFMTDTQILPMTWIRIPASKYTVMGDADRPSTCQLELLSSYEDIELVSDGDRSTLPEIAPLRVMSMDIETMVPPSNGFPRPTQEQVIQIACTVSLRRYSTNAETAAEFEQPFFRCVFALDSVAKIPGCQIFSFEDERDLLSEWRKFVINMDPDLIVGHNILKFDIPFLLLRASHLGLKDFALLGRQKDRRSTYRVEFKVEIRDKEETFSPVIPGRLVIDILHWARRNIKGTGTGLRTLETLSNKYLGSSKEGIKFQEISGLQKGETASAETRRELALYCLKDAYLAQQLCDKLRCLEDFYLRTSLDHHIPITWVTTQLPGFLQTMKKVANAKGEYIIADKMGG